MARVSLQIPVERGQKCSRALADPRWLCAADHEISDSAARTTGLLLRSSAQRAWQRTIKSIREQTGEVVTWL